MFYVKLLGNMVTDIKELLKKSVLVLDGAMGTMVQNADLQHLHTGPCDILTLKAPEIIKNIHYQYLEAGADIIETNTFSANSLSLKDHNQQDLVAEINYQSARIAKEQAQFFTGLNPQKPRFVAGVLGPGALSAGFSTDVNRPSYRAVTFGQLAESYGVQARALLRGGADLFMVETIFDTLNAKAALFAIREAMELEGREIPIMVSATVEGGSGRLLCGQTLEAFLISISHIPLLSVGLNCSFGPEHMKPWLKQLAVAAEKVFDYPLRISAHPNAGLPDIMGNYTQTPYVMSSYLKEYLQEGLVNIIGGCCGTTPEHIREIDKLVQQSSVREIVATEKTPYLKLSGLEPLVLTPEVGFLNVGERTNVAGSKKFLRLIKEKSYSRAVEIARKQAEGGAMAIDVNMDDGMLEAAAEMREFLNLLMSEPEVARLPVVVDSSEWSVQRAALEVLPGKSIVNSISLKEGEDKFIAHAKAIRKYGAAVVVMAFDEKGQADTFERRIEICTRVYKLLTEQAQYFPEDIIFDTNIFPVATGMEEHNNNAVNFFRAASWIRTNLPFANVSGGVSNVSFSFRGNNRVREAMHSAFLFHGIKNGMNIGIVNPEMLEVYDNINPELLQCVEDVLLNRRPDAADNLTNLAGRLAADTGDSPAIVIKTDAPSWRNAMVDELIKNALVRGTGEFLEQDIRSAMAQGYSAVEVIEKLLMAGMREVGELFGGGKMFLPQVVKSARVMKEAVAIVTPFITKDLAESAGAKTILMATVRGDVHDIGKNIVSVVLSCNGYAIDDMGVMVSPEDIADRAVAASPALIGLSGLITPSLNEMIEVVRELNKRGVTVPVLVGGATTSRIHTAVKIAPEYRGSVIHVSDASVAGTTVTALMGKETREVFLSQLNKDYQGLRERYYQRRENLSLLSLKEARANSLKIDWNSNESANLPGRVLNEVAEVSFEPANLLDVFDWEEFIKFWKPGPGKESLICEAVNLIKSSPANRLFEIKGVYGFFPACSVNSDDIEVYGVESEEPIATIVTLRQQLRKSNSSPNLALADFVPPKESGILGTIGAFCLSVTLSDAVNEPDKLMIQSIADRLVEASAEKLFCLVAGSGIRPAPGFPSLPDHLEKKTIWNLLQVKERIGASLTSNMGMVPVSTVCGYYFLNPVSKYFGVGIIAPDQVSDYAYRRGISAEEAHKWLSGYIQ